MKGIYELTGVDGTRNGLPVVQFRAGGTGLSEGKLTRASQRDLVGLTVSSSDEPLSITA